MEHHSVPDVHMRDSIKAAESEKREKRAFCISSKRHG